MPGRDPMSIPLICQTKLGAEFRRDDGRHRHIRTCTHQGPALYLHKSDMPSHFFLFYWSSYWPNTPFSPFGSPGHACATTRIWRRLPRRRLTKNTDGMGALVESAYGSAAAERFKQLWFTHVRLLFNYARGVADRDDSVTAEVRAELADYTVSLSRFVEEATKTGRPCFCGASGVGDAR
jgi:hypothetical protein